MSQNSKIKDDYYVNKLPVRDIVFQYRLLRHHVNASREKIFERWEPYVHPRLKCEYCDVSMVSRFLHRGVKESHLKFEPVLSALKPLCIAIDDDHSPFDRSWDQRSATAFIVEKGYKVSIPSCSACGHIPVEQCSCEFCSNVAIANKEVVVDTIFQQLTSEGILPLNALGCQDLLEIVYGFALAVGADIRRAGSLGAKDLSLEQSKRLTTLGVLLPTKSSIRGSIKMVSVYRYSFYRDQIQLSLAGEQTIAEFIFDLRRFAAESVYNPRNSWSIIDIWEGLALEEALGVMEYYCGMQDIAFRSESKLISLVQKSLIRFGLAQTSRDICNSVRRARIQMAESSKNNEASKYISDNLSFWIDDERAKDYVALPFRRGSGILEETLLVAVFTNYFLEPNQINYFTAPIVSESLRRRNN